MDKSSAPSFVKAAQSGGVAKGTPARPSGVIGKGDGLKTAWKDQATRPSVLTNMSAARKKVR